MLQYCSTRLSRPVSAILFAAILGCGGPKTIPVKGKVVYSDGSAMISGMVVTESIGEGAVKSGARGVIQADGTFELGTNAPGDGALEGEHRALVVAAPVAEGSPAQGATIDPKYRN